MTPLLVLVGLSLLAQAAPQGEIHVACDSAEPQRTQSRCAWLIGGEDHPLVAALTAASFSTAKLGFTSILNTIAVRLVGNCRTVVLYSWTLLM